MQSFIEIGIKMLPNDFQVKLKTLDFIAIMIKLRRNLQKLLLEKRLKLKLEIKEKSFLSN